MHYICINNFIYLFFVYLGIFCYCHSITVVQNFPFYPPPHSPSPPPIVSPLTVVHAHESFTHDPFLFFPLYSFSPSPLAAASLFIVSMALVLFCSLVYFVHQILLISGIIWQLFYTDWLISLGIIVSSSNHAVAKGRNSFFLSVVQYSVA